MVIFSFISFSKTSMFFDDEAGATAPDATADVAAPAAPEAPAAEASAE